ncbi:NucA/NucB deoxyribonuclease domain-containing protein [Priestia endophytica]|uniref:NucA/NucB deoxyribonuclease domain-containing protein n=1 Tax=Priestia endophytica TaxID=135735 RepID=UPI00228237FE|nr:NucA/NucB deoxyribonuclease domain-containing protein [Priestia endophytica]MCY8235431.1 NucA/NucB deoxyribonuclease domain-containing protein [Priestia endophytica]
MKKYYKFVALLFTLCIFFAAPVEMEAKVNSSSEVTEKEKNEINQAKPELYFIPTSDPEKADEVISQLKQGKSPETLGLISSQKHSPREQTLEQMNSEVKKNAVTIMEERTDKGKDSVMANSITASDGDDWTPPSFQYDDITFDSCVENEKAASGWIKNRYSQCWSSYVVYSDPVGCGPSWFPFGCDWVAFRVTVIANGYNGFRGVTYNYTIDDIDSDFDSKGWRRGSKVTLSTECDGISETRDCIGADENVTRTLANWESSSHYQFYITSEAPPITNNNKDRVSYMDMWPRITVDPPSKKYPPLTNDGPKETIRMDSADYLFTPGFSKREGAIFANFIPTFTYDMNDPYFNIMKEAFQHHKDALTSEGSLIPGKEPKPPLTRIYSAYDREQYNKNTNAKNQACKNLNKPEGYECDEFPFASTYEGAGKGDGKFSVRYIPRDANNTHGRWLAAWYAYNRILHKDSFYIGFRE